MIGLKFKFFYQIRGMEMFGCTQDPPEQPSRASFLWGYLHSKLYVTHLTLIAEVEQKISRHYSSIYEDDRAHN